MAYIKQVFWTVSILSATTFWGCEVEVQGERSGDKQAAADKESGDDHGEGNGDDSSEDKDINKPSTDDDPASSDPNHDEDKDKKEKEPILFDADLVSVDYDKVSDEIVLVLRHAICSNTFKPKLVINDACGESYPLSCSATIESEEPFKQTCENFAPSKVELRASVAGVEKPANFSIRGKTKTIGSILIEQ